MMLNPPRSLRKRSHIPTGLSLPCLSGLHSLTSLNLSDRNLSEEAMPSDFGCLASLKELDLMNNQFVRLPESISQLSHLEFLSLNGCLKLRIVPELSSNVWVSAINCMSLDTLGNQIGQSNSVTVGNYTNCFKMKNERCESIALPLLTRYFESNLYYHKFGTIFVGPGNEIPEWCNHQSVGSSITLELHPGWLTDKFLGFAFCVVFRLLKPLPPSVFWSMCCSLKANGKLLGRTSQPAFGRFLGQPRGDHVCFFYMSKFPEELQDIYYQFKLSFKPICCGDYSKNVQMKKCGVRVVYEQDMEELRQTLLKQRNSKRGLQLSDVDDDDEDAASSSASQAHPKRIKLLHLDSAGSSGSPDTHDEKKFN